MLVVAAEAEPDVRRGRDRKSTRLNSSHRCISYAVFCLKKKNNGRRGSVDSTAAFHPGVRYRRSRVRQECVRASDCAEPTCPSLAHVRMWYRQSTVVHVQ